jgi:hypothetical protein
VDALIGACATTEDVNVSRSTSADGSLTLSAGRCTFAFRRLDPGALLVTITGDDDGSLGRAPLDEIEAELRRYPRLDLYVDASAATGVATEVRDAWTALFRERRDQLQRVTVLTSSPIVHLAVSAGKLFSGTAEMVRVVRDPLAFRADLVAAGDRPQPFRTQGLLPPVRREVLADGSVRISGDGVVFEVRRPRRGRLHLVVTGHDRGQVGNASLDELTTSIDAATELFVDARAATSVTPYVVDAWIAWLKAHRGRIRRVHMLPGPPALRLALSVEKHLSGAGEWFRMYDSPTSFDAALLR